MLCVVRLSGCQVIEICFSIVIIVLVVVIVICRGLPGFHIQLFMLNSKFIILIPVLVNLRIQVILSVIIFKEVKDAAE